MSNDLRSKTVKAIGHLGAAGALGKIISLGSTLVLARILTPADYGLMALAMVVIGFVGFFNEVGIGSAIVQKPKLNAEEVNGCFAIALMASTVLFTGTVLLSGVLAGFFGNPKLGPMIAVLASAFVLGAFGTVPLAFLRKDMQFKAIGGITILVSLTQTLLCLLLAWLGWGVWALVWSFIAASALQSGAALYLSAWRLKGGIGLRAAKDLVMYGLQITSTRVFWYLYMNADKVIIGRVIGEKAVGVYDMAFSLATLPSSQITTLATNVAAPLFAKLQHDMDELNSFLLHFTRGVAYATYPALIGMLVVSRELIPVILGDKWDAVLVPFGALCLMGLIKSVDPLLSQVLISTGYARKLSAYTLMCGVVISGSMVAGAIYGGLLGVSLVWVCVYPILSVKLLYETCKITGLKMSAYYMAILPVLAGAVAMAIGVLAIRALAFAAGLPLFGVLLCEVIGGGVVYLLWIVYLDRRGVSEIRQVMIDLGVPAHKFDRWPFDRAVTAS
jgi:O-antigen/teichoic acid export membrane protein